MEEFDRLESGEKTVAVLGQINTAKQDGERISNKHRFYVIYGKSVREFTAKLLEVPLLGVGTVLRLPRGAWSMVKSLRQATNEYAPPPRLPPPRLHYRWHFCTTKSP